MFFPVYHLHSSDSSSQTNRLFSSGLWYRAVWFGGERLFHLQGRDQSMNIQICIQIKQRSNKSGINVKLWPFFNNHSVGGSGGNGVYGDSVGDNGPCLDVNRVYGDSVGDNGGSWHNCVCITKITSHFPRFVESFLRYLMTPYQVQCLHCVIMKITMNIEQTRLKMKGAMGIYKIYFLRICLKNYIHLTK
jgi:hypothetical protein